MRSWIWTIKRSSTEQKSRSLPPTPICGGMIGNATHSGRIKKLKMGGFLGEITFEGDLAEFLPFLKLGEYLHIGKGTVYGLGKYEIVGE